MLKAKFGILLLAVSLLASSPAAAQDPPARTKEPSAPAPTNFDKLGPQPGDQVPALHNRSIKGPEKSTADY